MVLTPYSLMYQTVFFENQQGPVKETLLQNLKPFFYRGIPEPTVVLPILPVLSIPEKKVINSPPPSIKPIQKTLFWCLYHANHGPPLYVEKYDINMELKERHKMADFFRENNRVLKDRRHRLTNADVDEILSNILTLSSRKTFWTTCFGDISADISQAIVFAQYYKKNIVICIPERRIQVSFMYEDQADKITLLYNPVNNLFEITDEETTGYLSMETMKTTLKPVSQYKIGELLEMWQQVGLVSPPKKKAEIYQGIIEHCRGVYVSSSSC